MDKRLTRQGVCDLNPVGHNGHRNKRSRCTHWFCGPSVVIGHCWQTDPCDGSTYEKPVWGKKCAWCGEERER